MLFALILMVIAAFYGIVIGGIQGYLGGRTDITMQRIIEVWSALPFLYVVMLIGSIYGRTFTILVVVMSLFSWIGLSYYMRGEFLKIKNMNYVQAARALGIGPLRIFFRHILPNSLTPVITILPFVLISGNRFAYGPGLPGLRPAAAHAFLGRTHEAGSGYDSIRALAGDIGHVGAVHHAAAGHLHRRRRARSIRPAGRISSGIMSEDAKEKDEMDAADAIDASRSDAIRGDANDIKDEDLTREEAGPEPVLRVEDLSIGFVTDEGDTVAITDQVRFDLRAGEIYGLVGESGCGKTVTSLALLRLLPVPSGRVLSGSVRLKGDDILNMSTEELRAVRGKPHVHDLPGTQRGHESPADRGKTIAGRFRVSRLRRQSPETDSGIAGARGHRRSAPGAGSLSPMNSRAACCKE